MIRSENIFLPVSPVTPNHITQKGFPAKFCSILHSRPGYAESDREAVDNDDEWFSHKDLLPFLKNVRSVPPSVLTPAHSPTFIPSRRGTDGFSSTLSPHSKPNQPWSIVPLYWALLFCVCREI